MVSEFSWVSFLKQFSSELLDDKDISSTLSPEIKESGWLGFQSASEQDVTELEKKIHLHLPPSYRQFLLATNGWQQIGKFVYRLLPANEVDWFRMNNQDWIEAYAGLTVPDEKYFIYGPSQDPVFIRSEYLKETLQISDIGDSSVCLLNPMVQNERGEWEAWFLANWLPGAIRYESFKKLIEGQREQFLGLTNEGS